MWAAPVMCSADSRHNKLRYVMRLVSKRYRKYGAPSIKGAFKQFTFNEMFPELVYKQIVCLQREE